MHLVGFTIEKLFGFGTATFFFLIPIQKFTVKFVCLYGFSAVKIYCTAFLL